MRFLPILVSLLAPAIAAQSDSSTDSTTISIQPVSLSPSAPVPLAKIAYNPSTLTSSLLSYYAPELPTSDNQSLLKIGIYDSSSQTWKSSTSVTSTETFSKGFAPTFVVTLDAEGRVLGVSVKSARIDAGQTRDFGPQVVVRATSRGKQAALNKPVVLNPEGKLDAPIVEKTLLQKYWWVGLAVIGLLATSGGE